MEEFQLKNILKICKNSMGPDGLKTQDLQMPQLSWIILLKLFDHLEQERETLEKNFIEGIPKPFRWRDWAGVADKGMNGDKLISFINLELFPALANLSDTEGPISRVVIRSAFTDFKNRILDGYALRKIINEIDKIRFDLPSVMKEFTRVYTDELLEWVNVAEKNAYFFTPRSLSRFIVSKIRPDFKRRERVFDPACGLGGFLIESFEYMKKDEREKEDIKKLRYESLIGHEKNAEFYLCGVLNLILNGIDTPNVLNMNSLMRPTKDIPLEGEYEIIMTNPSYNEPESNDIAENLPYELKTRDTALHFLFLVMEQLRNNGRAAIILPNGPLFAGGVAAKIKRRLLENFNLHTIIRLPESIFAPRTGISTNILFFEKGRPTKEIWYYEMKMPSRLQDPNMPDRKINYTKTSPPIIEDFEEVSKWYDNKKVGENAWRVKIEDIKDYDLDQKNPNVKSAENELSPHELISRILEDERNTLSLLEEVEQIMQKEIPK